MSLFYHMNESQKVEEITMKWPAHGYVIPAGTPMSRTGVANNGDAIGILASEARVRFPYPLSVANKIGKKEPKGNLDYEFSVITGGFVNRTEAEAAFGDTYSDAAISAMSGISFVTPESAKLGGSSLKKYTAEKTDGGYLVYGETKPMLERFPTLTVKGTSATAYTSLLTKELITPDEAAALVGREIFYQGEKYTIKRATVNGTASALLELTGEVLSEHGAIISPAPEPVPASELTAALASGTVQLECDGETVNIGTWTAVEDGKITGSAGGVTSWNDLTDRPFGEKSVVEVKLNKEPLVYEQYRDNYTVHVWVDYPLYPVVGNEYIIEVNNERYECLAMDDGSGDVCFGDIRASNGNDEYTVPFYFKVCPQIDNDVDTSFAHAKAGVYTVNIIEVVEKTTTIPSEMLPEGYPYWEVKEKVLVEEMNVTTSDTGNGIFAQNPFAINLKGGQKYIVIWDGTPYECLCADDPAVYVGNGKLVGMENDTGEPFFVGISGNGSFVYSATAGTHTISITTIEETLVTLDEKYLPEALQFGETVVSEEVLGETSFEISDNSTPSYVVNPFSLTLVEGWKYIVKWNGVTYVTNCVNQGGCWIGNGSLVGMPEDNGMPFFIGNNGSDIEVYGEPGIHTISVTCEGVKVERLATKYAPTYFDIFINNSDAEFANDNVVELDINYELSSGKTLKEIIEALDTVPCRVCINNVYGSSSSKLRFNIVSWAAGYEYGVINGVDIELTMTNGDKGHAKIVVV